MEERMTKFEVGMTTCEVRIAKCEWQTTNQLRMTDDLRIQRTPAVQLLNERRMAQLNHR